MRLAVRRSLRALPLSERRLRSVARGALQAGKQQGNVALAVFFVGERTMQSLNLAFAGKDYVTDVLAFAALEGAPGMRAHRAETDLGDVVICLPQATRQARTAQHPLASEVDLLLAHGVLHLLGYDHDTRDRRRVMERAQARALARV